MEMPKRLPTVSLNPCDVVQKHLVLAFGGEHLKLTNCSPIHRGADLGDALARNMCAVTQDERARNLAQYNLLCCLATCRHKMDGVVAHAACHFT